MESVQNIIKLDDAINNAAYWNNSIEDRDPHYIAFIKVMKYRKEIAIKYLEERDENKKEVIREIFEHCQNQIRQILGL